jgi:hypothetical protein
MYRVADVVFSILGRTGRIDDTDCELLEECGVLLGACWADVYGTLTFPPLIHQTVEHTVDQARRVRAMAIVSESMGESLHAGENARDRQFPGSLSLDYERLERLKEKLRQLKDSKKTKALLHEHLQLTARGPKNVLKQKRDAEQAVKEEGRAIIVASVRSKFPKTITEEDSKENDE